MHITLASVISLNGKITKGDDPNIHVWSSGEDWEHFVRLRDECEVIIIDYKTYEMVRPAPEEGKLRVVVTSKPEQSTTASIAGQLKFVSEPPTEIIERLAAQDYKRALIAGGASLCSSFLAAGLIDDLYISFEPVLFGTGEPMLSETMLDAQLQLQSVKKLNERGTLLVHYIVAKNKLTVSN